MDEKMSGSSRQGVVVARAASALQAALGEWHRVNPGSSIEVRITPTTTGEHGGTEPGGGGTVMECKFIIIGRTAEEANKHGLELQNQGCSCASSGPTEVTCDCKD